MSKLGPLLTLIFCNFLLASCGSFTREDSELAKRYLQLGSSQLESGEYPQALSTLLKAESLDPDNALIQNNLGLAYFVREHYKDALSHLNKAVKLKPDYSDAYNNIGRVRIEMGTPLEAIPYLEKALLDLTYAAPEKPLNNLGIAYFNNHNYVKAQSYFEKTLSIRRDDCIAHAYLGRCYYEEKNFGKASSELDRAIGFCEKLSYDEPRYYSGLSYYELGFRDKAISRLESLIKLFPNSKYAERARSMLEIIKGRDL